MSHSEHLAAELPSAHPLLKTLRRVRPIVIAILAIGLATGAAFIALVWLDSSIRFLTPAVIRLGAAEAPPQASWHAAPALALITPRN
jgi:hypothetical protein